MESTIRKQALAWWHGLSQEKKELLEENHYVAYNGLKWPTMYINIEEIYRNEVLNKQAGPRVDGFGRRLPDNIDL